MALPGNQEALQQQYQTRFQESAAYREQLWALLVKDFFQQYIDSSKAVLDIGCGWGEFINNVEARTKFAMDLNPDTEQKLAENIQFLCQSCAEPWPDQAHSLGTVFTSNFLEHLPDKSAVEATIAEARRCLSSNGVLLCMGPNIRFASGQYWDFWDHHIPISDRSLCEVLHLQGFEIVRCIPKFMPYTMSAGSNPPLFLVWLYLRFPLAWRLLGKQFLIVAKPRS